MKKILSIFLALMLVCSFSVNIFAEPAVTNQNFDESVFKNIGKDEVKKFILKNESAAYNVNGIKFTDSRIVYTPDQISFKTSAEVSEVLKAKDVEDLPYIKGILKCLEANSFENISEEQKADIVSKKLETNYENSAPIIIDQIVKVVDQKISDVQSYIGTASTIDMDFLISIDPKDANNISQNTVKISGLDCFDNEMNVNEFKLRTDDEIFESGIKDCEDYISNYQKGTNMNYASLVPINNYDSYSRLNARDYAFRWWGPKDSDYNPAYSNYNGRGGDCANFVSQCLFAGGIPTSRYWYTDSPYWLGAGNLKQYMVDNGYATNAAYTSTNAGNFAYTSANNGHIVLVTLNDTEHICYTAHNNNRYNQPFSNDMLSTYSFYVIKNNP